MSSTVIFGILIIFSYFIGSIPTGKILGLVRHIDIQKHGSGNIGFANAVRVLGWPLALVVLCGDTVKGFIPTYIAMQSLGGWQVGVVGLVAIIGHVFPVWLRFKGGKGIATGLGVTLAISPKLGAVGFITYLFLMALLRKSGPSSVITSWTMIIWGLFLSPTIALYYAVLAIFATWTHRVNIKQFISNE